MTDPAGVITAIAAVISAVGVITASYWAYRGKQRASDAAEKAESTEARLIELDGKVYQLGVNVDGRLSQLLVSTRAEGVLQGEASQRERQIGETP